MDRHKPVLLQAVCSLLEGKKVIVDCTLGLGGHAEALLSASPKTSLIGFDLDAKNLKDAGSRLKKYGTRLTLVHDNFSTLKNRLEGLGVKKVDGILLDLGLSSPHIDESDRGFSFRLEGPLDMRFDRSTGLTAAEYLNLVSKDDLTKVIKEFGEDRDAYRIAATIVRNRAEKPLATTQDLVELIKKAVHPKYVKDSIVRVFQALRIEINQELDVLKNVLPQAIEVLAPGGVLVVISYHSLEDRIVKRFFVEEAKDCVCPMEIPLCVCNKQPSLKILTKRPLVPEAAEIEENPRSRSAKLRAIEKISLTK